MTHITFWAKRTGTALVAGILWSLSVHGSHIHVVESIVECHTAQTAWPNSKHHTHTSLLHIYICMLLEVLKATIWS